VTVNSNTRRLPAGDPYRKEVSAEASRLAAKS
jgi:hypothetical protein